MSLVKISCGTIYNLKECLVKAIRTKLKGNIRMASPTAKEFVIMREHIPLLQIIIKDYLSHIPETKESYTDTYDPNDLKKYN